MNKKRFLSIAICICLMINLISVLTVSSYASVTYNTVSGLTNAYTYVRSAPYWTSSVVDTTASGVAITIFEREYDYLYVQYTNNGIVKRGYIPIANTSATGYSWCNHEYYVPGESKVTSAISVRYGAGNSYNVIETIPAASGTSTLYPLLILASQNGYYYVQYLSNTDATGDTNPKFSRGWVLMSQIALKLPSAPAYLVPEIDEDSSSEVTDAMYNETFVEISNSSGLYLTAVADSTATSGYSLSFTTGTSANNQQWILHRTYGYNNAVYYKIESYSCGLFIEVQNKIPVLNSKFILSVESSPNKAQEFALSGIASLTNIKARCSGDFLVAMYSSNQLLLHRSTSSNTSFKIKVHPTNHTHLASLKTLKPHTGFSSATIYNFIAAADLWNTQIGQNMISVSTTTHTKTGFQDSSSDGENCIYAENTGTDTYCQRTKWRFNKNTGVVTEIDINVNTYFSWTNGAESSKYDYASAFVHELGHGLGLSHSSVVESVMYKSLSTNTIKRMLHSSDTHLIKLYYGYY